MLSFRSSAAALCSSEMRLRKGSYWPRDTQLVVVSEARIQTQMDFPPKLLTPSSPCLPSSCPAKPVSLTKQQKDYRPWFFLQKSELQKFWPLQVVFFFLNILLASKRI